MKLATVTTALLALALAIPNIASASVRDCHYPYGHGPRNDRLMNGSAVSARNITCSSALRAISHGYLRENGSPLRTRGFTCYTVSKFEIHTPRRPPLVTGATIRCVSGRRAFRFSWAT